jgi:growth hormone-inducible transmembrane protein
MSFILRRPFAVSVAFKQVSKPSTAARLFHSSPFKSSPKSSPLFTSKAPSYTAANSTKSKPIFQNAFKRSYQQQPYQVSKPDAGVMTKLLYGAAIVGGTAVAINVVFNRETREDGGMPEYERSFLNETFLHTGLGIGIIGVAARALHTSGWSYRLMATNPWAVIGLSLVASIGTMYGTFYTAPEK